MTVWPTPKLLPEKSTETFQVDKLVRDYILQSGKDWEENKSYRKFKNWCEKNVSYLLFEKFAFVKNGCLRILKVFTSMKAILWVIMPKATVRYVNTEELNLWVTFLWWDLSSIEEREKQSWKYWRRRNTSLEQCERFDATDEGSNFKNKNESVVDFDFYKMTSEKFRHLLFTQIFFRSTEKNN